MTDLRTWVEKVRADYGVLTPRIMVTAAREDGPEGCPIYDRLRFDDDESAAELWRIDQARSVLRRLRVVYRESTARTPERSVRAYHAIPQTGQKAYHYERVEDVAVDPISRELLLREMEREWKQLKARYGHMREFVALVTADLAESQAA